MSEHPLSADAPLVEAVRAIEQSRRRLAVVVDSERRLLGTLTDGDVRRCLLAGGSLETLVAKAMNTAPITAWTGSPDGYLLDLMRRGNVLAVPIVDADRRFLKLVHLSDLAPEGHASGGAEQFAFAVIMAGGEGARLRPLTSRIPKPMVDIGGVPLLERQVRRLARAGIGRIYLSVNYLSHVIEDHFQDGAGFGVELRYLREREKMGTAGALSLLPERPQGPIIVMNGDILTTLDFAGLFAFHQAHQAVVTVAAIDYRVSVPYGVIVAEDHRVSALHEKPAQRFLCNAGMYALAPAALTGIPAARIYDMTELIADCLAASLPIAVFPLHEYWSDIGTPDDLDRARALFSERTS